jgi:hypothetical protein
LLRIAFVPFVFFVVQNILVLSSRRNLLLFVFLTTAAHVRAEPQVAQFVAGLRERGLYELAAEYGSEKWQRSDLTDRQRADLAIQLALVYTDWALASPPEARDQLWSRASDICAQFAEGWPENPRRPLVEVQAALVSLARGELAREENVATAAGAVNTAALEHLRIAARGLEEVLEDVGKRLIELRLRPPTQASPDALTARELESLEVNIAYHQARAQRQLGLCYPPLTADRDNSLLQAVGRLTPLTQRMPADELAWNARVELVACLRELGRLQAAQETLRMASRERAPEDVASLLSAEEVRLLIAAGQLLRAQEATRQATRKHDGGNGELALATLEAELAVRHQSEREGARQDGRQLTEMVNRIQEQHGPYWGRRAQILVGHILTSGNGIDAAKADPETILMAAKQLYASDRIDEAVANYDLAAQNFEQRGKVDEAFAASMTAAAIEREAGHAAAAADRYRRLALKLPSHARAAEAHQVAILCVAQKAADSAAPDRPAVAADYEQLLQEHLTKWPNAASSDAVRLWLGKLLAARSEWQAVIQVLRQVRKDAQEYPESIRFLCDCYERQFERLEDSEQVEDEQPQATLLADATNQLQPVITGADNRWPTQWTNLQRETALRLARLHLKNSSGPSPYAERLLAALVASAPAGEDGSAEEWLAAARPLFIVALARNGKPSEALAIFADLRRTPAASLREAVELIDKFIAQGPDTGIALPETGQVALELVGRLAARRVELDPTTLSRIDMYRAAALAAAGDHWEATKLYSQLAIQSPDDADIHERYARVLALSESKIELRRALSVWLVIERRSRRGGPRWRRARQARIELLTKIGDRAEADKLEQLTRLLYADWDAGTGR